MKKVPKSKCPLEACMSLDRVFHEKARLAIMTCLVSEPEGLSFADLKQLCELSDGNLNRHLDALKEAEAIIVDRQGAGRASRTTVSLSKKGRKQFEQYLVELEHVVSTAAKAMGRDSSSSTFSSKFGLAQ